MPGSSRSERPFVVHQPRGHCLPAVSCWLSPYTSASCLLCRSHSPGADSLSAYRYTIQGVDFHAHSLLPNKFTGREPFPGALVYHESQRRLQVLVANSAQTYSDPYRPRFWKLRIPGVPPILAVVPPLLTSVSGSQRRERAPPELIREEFQAQPCLTGRGVSTQACARPGAKQDGAFYCQAQVTFLGARQRGRGQGEGVPQSSGELALDGEGACVSSENSSAPAPGTHPGPWLLDRVECQQSLQKESPDWGAACPPAPVGGPFRSSHFSIPGFSCEDK